MTARASAPGLSHEREREKRLLAEVSNAVGEVFASVERLPVAMLSIVERVRLAGRALQRADLLGLRPAVADVLARHASFVAGTGVVMAPGALADAPLWIEWFWSSPSSALERLLVDLDPESAEFYDYTTTEWYREPQRTGERHIAGPYVDYICTHKYTFTLSAPLYDRGRFIGVAGADILASEVERLIVPRLAELPRVAALASAGGRVIASNSAQLLPGMILGRGHEGVALRPVAGPGDVPQQQPLPWVLLEGDARVAAAPA